MARIADGIEGLIGETPLLRLRRFAAGTAADILAKLEAANPAGSDKDRFVLALLDAAQADGAFSPGRAIVEATSGNLAFALAALAVPRGWRVVLVMPDAVPEGRVQLLRAMGAEVILTPAALGMEGATARAEALLRELPGALRPNQFANPLNPAAHERTADEIWAACEGALAAVVVPVGTGGMVAGIGRRLKGLSGGAVRVVAVEPAASPVLSGGAAGPHRLWGMGAPFVPANFDSHVVDEVVAVSDNEAHDTLLRLFRTEGLMSGPAGAAALAAALRLAARSEVAGQRLVALVPDHMERYAGLDYWATFRAMIPTESLVREF